MGSQGVLPRHPSLRGLLFLLAAGVVSGWAPIAAAEPASAQYQSGTGSLTIEWLTDRMFRVELSTLAPGTVAQGIGHSPMVARTDWPGPRDWSSSGSAGGHVQTSDLIVDVDPVSLCIRVQDRHGQGELAQVCPAPQGDHPGGLVVDAPRATDIYGLGEQVVAPGRVNGTWAGLVRKPGDAAGNHMTPFGLGDNGNAQFPIAYALGDGNWNFALFVDQIEPQTWDLSTTPWRIGVRSDRLRWYFIAGTDLPALRRQYMDLTGRPPVPPRKMFGLWVSQYGYRNWGEIDTTLQSLRQHEFPVDGFILDLQWFGGITGKSEQSRMGSLDWDPEAFAQAPDHLRHYRDEGIGIIPIEEPFVARGLPEHAALAQRGALVRQGCASCLPVFLDANPWWGKGGMIDWTNPAAGDYWHDLKREPLIAAGVMGHWTDLGEPEAYDPGEWVEGSGLSGHDSASYHNAYGLLWAQSVVRGYARNGHAQRPMVLARSGTSGIQRYDTAMWSGDIGSQLDSLAAHENARMHMSLSGIDYFGSDTGGFYRHGMSGKALDDLFTRWFAVSALLDVPLRPHTENLCVCQQTAPDRVGDLRSNLRNVRQRYELTPYLYSLAYRAWLEGEPVTPPLVYAFQQDPAVRALGDEKMIGPALLADLSAGLGQPRERSYLPAGDWAEWQSGAWHTSRGEWVSSHATAQDGTFALPLYARAGAIIPVMKTGSAIRNVFGEAQSGAPGALALRVIASADPNSFTVYEDDGWSIAYQQGGYRRTLVHQALTDHRESVRIDAAQGGYDGAPQRRTQIVEVVSREGAVKSVVVNGRPLAHVDDVKAWESAAEGWRATADGQVVARQQDVPVDTAQEYQFEFTPLLAAH